MKISLVTCANQTRIGIKATYEKTGQMEAKSELEQFLASRSTEGQIESHGTFTVGAEEALRKIAEYQLPFAGAWAVKIIQSIVAAQSTSPIRVDLAATEIRFYFMASGFTFGEFETAFYNPDPSPNRALRHLLSGLWPVALKERWGFQIAFPRQSETLIWDGEHMNRVESSVARDCASISVAPLQSRTALSWVAGMATSGKRNAELLLALGTSCYTCPLPLTVDGRRLDSLQRAEHQGWSKGTFPMTIGFAEADLPEFRLPPGTFEGVTDPLDAGSFFSETLDGGGWRRIGEKRLQNLPARECAHLAFILCLNLKRVQSGKSVTWETTVGPSTVYWVLDGAVVSTEPLMKRACYSSLGCFLNAEGLQTDLSTFHLLESSERQQRIGLAREALLPALRSVDDESYEDLVKRGKLLQRIGGGATATVGLALLGGAPFYGLLAVIGGGIIFWMAGSSEEEKVRSARASRRDLITALERSRLAR